MSDIVGGLWYALWVHVYALVNLMSFLLPHSTELDDDTVTRRRQPMPELEEMKLASRSEDDNEETRSMDELEPAFLREEDYPPGWMVYDRESGVILKTEADKLKQKRQQRCQEETVCNDETVCIESGFGVESQPLEIEERKKNIASQTESEPPIKQSHVATGEGRDLVSNRNESFARTESFGEGRDDVST